MVVMDVHLRELRAFVAVAEQASFTLAAAQLLVSQPALSKQVRQLEKQLDARLLTRGPRGVTLTTAGEALLPLAREQIRHWGEAQGHVAAAASTSNCVLTVGFSTAIGRGLISGASEYFLRRQPGWRLALRQVGWGDPTAGLADATTDIAILWLPLPDADRFDWQVLAAEPRHVALPRQHPLADRDIVAFTELLDEPFLALPESATVLRDHWLAVEHRLFRGRIVRGDSQRSRDRPGQRRQRRHLRPFRRCHPTGHRFETKPTRSGLAPQRQPHRDRRLRRRMRGNASGPARVHTHPGHRNRTLTSQRVAAAHRGQWLHRRAAAAAADRLQPRRTDHSDR